MYPNLSQDFLANKTDAHAVGVSGPVAPRSDLLARVTKAMTHNDVVLADLFDMVQGLSEKLVGGNQVAAKNAESPHPHAPGALNEILWLTDAQSGHLCLLRERLAYLLAEL